MIPLARSKAGRPLRATSRSCSCSSSASTGGNIRANFPHCLQRTDIPGPRTRIGTRKLLRYLPNTDAISQSATFYFTFAFSTPYEPFLPLRGVSADLFFPGGRSDRRNQALIDFRKGPRAFINEYQPDMPQPFQWPLNIET